MPTITRVIRNRAQCAKCGDIIESTNRHDFVTCGCGEISVDGGLDYLRRSAGSWVNLIELSETQDEDLESPWRYEQ